MAGQKYTIVESWPMIKDDLQEFSSDTDAWIISRLKEVCETKEWEKVKSLIEIMEMLHNIQHSHTQ